MLYHKGDTVKLVNIFFK